MFTSVRTFLFATILLVGLSGQSMAAETFAAPSGEVILTVKGAITARNRGDEVQLDRELLASLPQATFSTSTNWTEGRPNFQGVLLKDLLAAVGANGTMVTLTAANDYAITIPLADAGDTAPLLAYLMDGNPMSLRDKGPVWMVYPYDTDPAFQTEETYARSIWQLVEITVAQ